MPDKISLTEQFRNCVLYCGEKIVAQADFAQGFGTAQGRDEKARCGDNAFKAMLKRLEEAEKIEARLHALIDAWEALPGGRRYSRETVQAWLARDMATAINAARVALHRVEPVKVTNYVPR